MKWKMDEEKRDDTNKNKKRKGRPKSKHVNNYI